MNRKSAYEYVAYAVNDALAEMPIPSFEALPRGSKLVGWQCGFEPLFVVVFSYLPDTAIDEDEAIELATDLLTEKQWFAGAPSAPDYVL